jgi:hypothetical protein
VRGSEEKGKRRTPHEVDVMLDVPLDELLQIRHVLPTKLLEVGHSLVLLLDRVDSAGSRAENRVGFGFTKDGVESGVSYKRREVSWGVRERGEKGRTESTAGRKGRAGKSQFLLDVAD